MATLARAATLRSISNRAASIATCAFMVSAQLGTQGEGWVKRVFNSFNNDWSGVSAARLLVTRVPLINAVNASGRKKARALKKRPPVVVTVAAPAATLQHKPTKRGTPR